MTHTPTPQQNAIYQWMANPPPSQHLIVDAKAGSSKSYTIKHGLRVIPPGSTAIVLAFNTHIAKSMADEVPRGVTVSTTHSLFNSVVQDILGPCRIDVEGRKPWHILNHSVFPMFADIHMEESYTVKNVTSIISKLQSTLTPITPAGIDSILHNYSSTIDTDLDGEAYIDVVKEAMKQFESDISRITYDEMLWFPWKYKLPAPKSHTGQPYDYVIVDELQDWNRLQAELAMRMIGPNTHFIGVGDRNQAIYRFRGADTQSIPNITTRLNAVQLPLTISFRCPIDVIKLAQQFVPDIEWAPNAKQGTILNVAESDLYTHITPGTLCLCRLNGPLAAPALRLLLKGFKVCILGKDIGMGIVNTIMQLNAYNLIDLQKKLDQWIDIKRKHSAVTGKNIEHYEDRYMVISAFRKQVGSVGELINKVNAIFKDDAEQITFSTVHRAKGKEAKKVVIIAPELMPSPYAQEMDMEEEDHIQYVAITRSMDTLIYVRG